MMKTAGLALSWITIFGAACASSAGSHAGAKTPGSQALPPEASVPAAPPKSVASVEGITEYRLPNGLRVLLFPDPSKSTVTVNVTYLVGSRHEGYGETGMAHLLEHMAFKGTPTHPNILAQLERRGAMMNGTTDRDRTNYFETLPATADNLQYAVELEADRMIHCKIAKEDLATEFTVVRNEFEMGENNPEEILSERMQSTAYLWHNYGKSTIGAKSDIERVPADSLRRFYERYYQPDNAVLVIAGKFDPASALGLVQRSFGIIPTPARTLATTYTVEPVQDGERTVVLRRTGDVAVVGVMYHGVSGSDAGFAAEQALMDILTAKPSGRLYKALVEKGLAASLSGDADANAEPGMMGVLAKVRLDRSAETVRDRMITIIEALAAGKIGTEEVERFKTKALKQLELAMTNSERIGIQLSEFVAMGDWRMIFLHRDRIKALTVEQVQKVAQAYLKPANRTVGLFLPTQTPERSPAPAAVDVPALVKDYKGQKPMEQGEAFVATIDNVEKRTSRDALPSGMKLALLSKRTRGNAVKVTLQLHFGNEKDLRGKAAVVRMLPAMLMRGTHKHTYQQLRDRLDQLRAEVTFGEEGTAAFSARPDTALLRLTTVRENLPEVLAVVAEICEQPSFPKEELETLRKETLAKLEEQLQDPMAQAMNLLARKMNPWPKEDVRHLPSLAEAIEQLRALKLADLVSFHRAFFGGSHAELSIVGDFDEAMVRTELAKDFGSWTSAHPFARIAVPFKSGDASEELIKTPDKKMAFVGLGHALEIRDDDPDYPALVLINHMLGEGGKSRLFMRLREKEGLSYGAFSSLRADTFDRRGAFFAGAICAPENAAKAMTLLEQEVVRMVGEGFAAAELTEAKKSYQLQFDNRLAHDDFVAGELDKGLYAGRTLDYYRMVNAKVQKLTREELTQALHKYFEPGRMVKVKAGDLKN